VSCENIAFVKDMLYWRT